MIINKVTDRAKKLQVSLGQQSRDTAIQTRIS
jgi:hypothetical protein